MSSPYAPPARKAAVNIASLCLNFVIEFALLMGQDISSEHRLWHATDTDSSIQA
jgi:hypothetical protein